MQCDLSLRHRWTVSHPYLVAPSLELAERPGQKYDERQGVITDTMIRSHLAGEITLAAPAAISSQTHLLPLGRHAHASTFGQLFLAYTAPISIDNNPQAAYASLSAAFRYTPTSLLPLPPLLVQNAIQERPALSERIGLPIEDDNRQIDLVALRRLNRKEAVV